MTLVVDASVAMKWLVREPGNEAARALFDEPDPLIAPDWLLIDAASTLWKKVQRSELLGIHAARHLTDLPEFFSRLYPSAPLADEALEQGFRLHHSVYDCLYLALARREAATLVTADEKFFRRLDAAGLSGDVRLLRYRGGS